MSQQILHASAHPRSRSVRRDTTATALPVLFSFLLITLVHPTPLPAGEFAVPEASPTLYVFISASIPRASLLEIAKDAASHNAPLLLRGLVGTSLQETLLTLKDLVGLGAGLEVDPLLFEAYGVEAVPAVVLTCGPRGGGPYAMTYGLTPSQALPVLRRALPRC